MDLSVIICTWNNSNRLATTLHAISRCDIPKDLAWELVLVNNNCTDKTDAVAEEFGEKLPLVYVREPKPGLSHARMAGLAAASGELILFTDDDVTPWAGWVHAYWSAYQQKGDGFYFGGPIESEYEGSKPEAHLLALAPPSVRGLYYGNCARTLSPEESFIGPNWACPAKSIALAGGFDVSKGLNPSLKRLSVGEETDLMERLEKVGISSWYVPEAGLIHSVPAKKCSLRHIAARAEAYEFERAGVYFAGTRRFAMNHVPLVLYKWALGHWTRYVFAWITYDKNYAYHYVRLRRVIGTIRGLREMR